MIISTPTTTTDCKYLENNVWFTIDRGMSTEEKIRSNFGVLHQENNKDEEFSLLTSFLQSTERVLVCLSYTN